MRNILLTVAILLGACIAYNSIADEKQDKAKPKVIKPKPVPVYLGRSGIDGGSISKPVFDSLLKQGLTSRDSAGREYKVNSFFLTLCERNYYEDSVGNPLVMTDYISEYCFSDTLQQHQLSYLLEHSKRGDTMIFEQIKLTSVDSAKPAYGKGIKLSIR